MRLGLMMMVIAVGGGCGEDGAGRGGPGGADGLGANDGPCYVLADGEWSADGEAFGGPNSAVLTMDAEACTVSLAEWAENPEGPEPAAAFEHPIEGMLAEERRDQLAQALARLAPDKRELLLLARSGELRYEAIGELLGVSVGAVKLRVHRAMKDLRGAYQRVAGEAGA